MLERVQILDSILAVALQTVTIVGIVKARHRKNDDGPKN